MSTIGEIKEARGIGGPPLLRGQDVPRSINEVKIKCRELREAPSQFKSPAIMDLASPAYDREAWAINITNLRAIAEKLGFKEPDKTEFDEIAKKAAGKEFKLTVVLVNNPQTHKMVRSLMIV